MKKHSLIMQEANKRVSRRNFLERCVCAMAVTGTTALPAWAYFPVTEVAYKMRKKVTMAAAHYQYHPHGRQHCAVCRHFRGPSSCEIVAGKISPKGWCRYFSAARAPAAGSSGGSY